MDWNEYNIAIIPLIKRFGAYDPQEIKTGYYYWKSKHQSELIENVDLAISIGTKLDLVKKPIIEYKVNIDTKNKWKEDLENRVITDGYMDKLINDSNCSSLVDLVFKNKK